jgi:hypothetical protein
MAIFRRRRFRPDVYVGSTSSFRAPTFPPAAAKAAAGGNVGGAASGREPDVNVGPKPLGAANGRERPSNPTAATANNDDGVLRALPWAGGTARPSAGFHFARAGFLLAVVLLCCGTTLAAETAPVGGQTDNALAEPLFSRQTSFSIPFKLSPTEDPDREPAVIELYVSTDRGRSWTFHSKADPKASSFPFRAGSDGEFWFQLRTVNRAGQGWPSTFDRPGLRIVVDTVPPKLEIGARRGPSGEIVVRWQVDEQHFNPESLKILYRTQGAEAWQPVAIDRKNLRPSGSLWSGQLTWWPQSAGAIEIRGDAADLAGNVAVNHAQVNIPTTGPDAGARADKPPMPPETTARADKPPMPPTMPPPGEQPRMVASRHFELDYEFGPVSPAEAVETELWGTRDGGQHWTSFGRATGPGTPFSVSVDEEGLYGFRATVRKADGSGGGPPQAGKMPEIWIAVDCTKPTCRIIAAERDQAGNLIIRWEAGDRWLATRPVTISLSPTPSGPWSTIASGLANTGQYAWPIDHRAPQQIYLRLEARDEAGNVGTAETSEPTRLGNFGF